MQNIEQKLESTLGRKSDLDSRLKSASSSVLTQKIEFQESSKPHSSVTDMLKGKYVNLAPAAGASVHKSPSGSDATDDGEGLPNPKQILFTEQLDFTWNHNSCGIGLTNSGNSCFLNATLQCLIHCPPLANYMMTGHHSSICRVNNYERCILCNLQFLTKKSLGYSGGMNASLNAKWFNNNLQWNVDSGPFFDIVMEQMSQKDIGRHFRIGRQEDAHEFLRLSLEKMQKCALIGYNGIDKYSKETTVINQIFGGYLRSQVICCRCGQKSNTYDPLLDVSLDIKAADNIERAFHQFVSPEKLENDNAYKCENCKQKVTAIKKFTIHKPPNVLTIQLKRFQFGSAGHFFGGGNKVHKPVRYPLHFDIRPFMSHKNGPPIKYTLYSSIQHEGMTCNSGHYVANVRCGTKWVNFNDSHRTGRSVHQCLNEHSAYILFYMRDVVSSPQIGPSLKTQNDQHSHWAKREEAERKQKLQQTNSRPSYAAVVKNSPAGHNNQKPAKPLTIAGQQSKSTTPAFFSKMFTAQPQQKMNSVPSNDVGKSVKSPFVPLSSDRDKVKFSIGEKNKVKEAHKILDMPKFSVKPELPSSPPKQSSPAKPISRINSNSSIKSEGSVCLKVDHGKSFTIECSPDGGRRIINQNEKHSKKSYKKRKIVPYGSDSDDSSSSLSPAHHGGSATDNRLKENGHKKSGLVLDGVLNATTSVPGNAHLYNTVTMKDKVSHKSSHHERRPKDLNMFSSKHGQSPPHKKQFNETLSCDTHAAPTKHSGTGEWHTSLESMQSPSIGSNHSSVHSSGSTQEWSVLKSKENVPSGSAERNHDGWTVTPGRKNTEKTRSKNTCAERVDQNGASSPFEDVSDRVLLIKPEKSKDKSSEEYKLYKKWKKHKKQKKRKHHEREHNYAELSDDSTGRSHKKKKKKRKHRDEEREEKKCVKQEREDEDKVEKYREREERKHKKYEREAEDKMERHREKEDRQHSRKHNRDFEDGYQQKYREDEKDDRQHKGRYDREGRDKSNKRRRQDSESSNEFEWVEKPVPVRASISEPVTPSHRWDHHVNDGYKRPSNSGTSTPTVSLSWDGLRASKVAQELEKVSSYGYGAPVSGWDGSKSQLDVEKESEYVSRKRKDSDDEYDDEFDRGKVKKVKHKHHNEHRHSDNLFQRKQDQINRSKINWSSMKVGENNPFNTQSKPERPQHKPYPS